MSKTFTSWSDLKSALQKEMKVAVEETIEESFKDAHENVDRFYDSTMGAYQRTGQLAESPEREVYGSGDVVEGEVRLDTSYRYHPSGRDTQTIYNYAEKDGLLGNGGFWAQTVKDFEKNKDKAFNKRFKK